MELSEILTLITIVWTLFKVFADAPKGWENACKAWEFVRPWLTNIKEPTWEEKGVSNCLEI